MYENKPPKVIILSYSSYGDMKVSIEDIIYEYHRVSLFKKNQIDKYIKHTNYGAALRVLNELCLVRSA